jgi:hypothetical protein
MKSSGSDDATVSKVIKKINVDNKTRFRYPDSSSARLIGASKCRAALSRLSSTCWVVAESEVQRAKSEAEAGA